MEQNFSVSETNEATKPLDKDCLAEKENISSQAVSVESSVKERHTRKKVEILLKATGDAPIMKTKKWSVESDRTVCSIIEFMKAYMKLSPGDNLFLYVNQSFAPSPDQIMLNLYECFGSDGKLVLYYSKTPAWG